MHGTKVKCTGTPMLSNCSIIFKNVLVPPCYQIAPKMCDFKQSHKCALERANGATFYIWEPHCGYLHKAKKVHWYPVIKEGQPSHKNVNCTGHYVEQ